MKAYPESVAATCLFCFLAFGCTEGETEPAVAENKEAAKAEDAAQEKTAQPQSEAAHIPAKITPKAAPATIALRKVQSALPSQSATDVRWAVDLQDRKVTKIWLPPQRLTPSISLDLDYFLVQTDRHDLIAFHSRSGRPLWWTRLTGPLTGDPSFSQYGLYFIVRSHVICLELHSGEVIWRLNLPFAPSAGPSVHEPNEGKPLLHVPGLDRKIYALEVEKDLWPPKHGAGSVSREDFVMEKWVLNILWRYATYSQIAGRVVYYDRQVFAADTKYNVYAIQSTDLAVGMPKHIRFFRTQGPMVIGPTVVGPHLYVPSRDRNLYCLRRRDVSEEWQYASGHLLEERVYPLVDPFLNKTTIVCKSGVAGPLVGLVDTTGKPRWELKDGKTLVGLFIDPENELKKRAIMVVHNMDASLSGHYASSGEELWRVPGKVFGPFCVNARDPLVYTAAFNSQIVCALQKAE